MSEENTISNISLNGVTYALDDSSKATIESVEELTSITSENNTLINSAHTKLDELLNRVNASELDTSDATAIASQILSGQTAYVNGVMISGTLDLSQLIPENIISGVVINGVSGVHVCSAGGSSDSLTDLVELGILTKQISEFTDADIGTIVSIPYTDASGIISGPIEFEVVGVNHHKDINDESKPTITLMSKNVLRYAAFDAREQSNPLYDEDYGENARAKYGNNRWSVSNIRQWLNSSGAANEWFTAQHEYDEAPTTDKVDGESGAYSDDPGFLVGFSADILQHFATVRNKTVLCNADKSSLSKDFEETEDKVFLPSSTEMGAGDLDSNNPEGSHITKFNSDESRIKTYNESNGYYWMRSPYPGCSIMMCKINDEGDGNGFNGCCDSSGVAPLLVLC